MNIKAGIAKLDELRALWSVGKITESEHRLLEFAKTILLAMSEGEDDKPDHWGYRVKIANLNKRLQTLESSKGELEKKVARLEAGLRSMDIEVNGKKPFEPIEPSSVSECKEIGSCMNCGEKYLFCECGNYEPFNPKSPSVAETAEKECSCLGRKVLDKGLCRYCGKQNDKEGV